MKDMYSHAGAVDVFVAEMADFPNAQAGGIHEGSHCFLFDVRDGADKFKDLLLGGDKGKVCIKPAFRYLGVIPWLVEDIDGEEAELRDSAVDGAVSKIPLLLDPPDVIAEFLPGDIFRLFMEDVLQVIQIRTDIGRVADKGMVRKTAQGDHLPVKIKIFVHNGTSLSLVFDSD